MKSYNNKRRIALITTVFQAFLYCTLVLSTTAYSQVVDTEAPIIGLDSISESFRGEPQVFTVTATDNVEVAALSIFYRLGDTGSYTRAEMSRVGDTDLFTHTIPEESINSSVGIVQYYIDARDTAGNRTLQGFSFDPLERTLLQPTPVLADSSEPVTEGSNSLLGSLTTTQKVVYGVVALAVVGVLVSSASGGDSDSGLSADDQDGQGTPVTVITAPLIPGQ